VSFCAALYSYGFSRFVHAESDFWLIFSGTLSVYLGHRLYKVKTHQIVIENNRIKWMKSNETAVRVLLFFSIIVALVLGIKYCLEQPLIMFPGALAVLIAIFYVVRVRNKNLRELPYAKVFWVTVVYWLIVICLSSFNSSNDLRFFGDDLYLAQFVYIMAIALLFDIPDVAIDSPAQKTIPQLLGEKRSILLSTFLVSIVLVYQVSVFEVNWKIFVLFICFIVFYWGLLLAKHKELYLSLFGEAILGLMGVYYLVCVTV
jgi:1,4-dihydroxy-2-naphthoate octaprenyltransferase